MKYIVAEFHSRLIFVIIFLFTLLAVAVTRWYRYQAVTVVTDEGHLKPFGCCNPMPVEKGVAGIREMEGWPSARLFFQEFVGPKKPLVMRNAAKISPAFRLWTDEYFLNDLDVPPNSKVQLEMRKKEKRNIGSTDMNFKDWIRIYNVSDLYMVQDVPSYLGKDVIFPPCLQCWSFINDYWTSISVMWMSSGGTRSVVHFDGHENINCLFRGNKTFVMVDPKLYGSKVPLDHEEGSYSSIDVDSVDFEKYPSLADVKYYNIHLEPGDCLFIPAGWIHQVNSYGSNLAVNTFFFQQAVKRINLSTCLDEYDPSITFDTVPHTGTDHSLEDMTNIFKSAVHVWLKDSASFTLEEFTSSLLGGEVERVTKEVGSDYTIQVAKLFHTLDKNLDDVLTLEEYNDSTEETHEDFVQNFHDLWTLFQAIKNERSDLRHVFQYAIYDYEVLVDDESEEADGETDSVNQGNEEGAGNTADNDINSKEEL